jgi:hypothetical protein
VPLLLKGHPTATLGLVVERGEGGREGGREGERGLERKEEECKQIIHNLKMFRKG